jgi:ABC-2 type transport system ATP-binding protein
MPIIEVEGLAKTFRTRRREAGLASSLRSFVAPKYREREAVKPISFSLEQGEVLAFIGPNGAGKSTTIKMLTGILYPSAGKAHVLGMIPWQQRRKLAFHIASVYGQKSQLWYHLPPQDTFNLLARIYELDMEEYRKRRSFLVDVFDIAEYMQTPARKLSLGERMRCELAAALLHKPSVVFLDEPTIGLDVIAKQRIRDLIGHLNTREGVTVFLTSHDAGDIEQVCRRAIVINHGEIILDAPVARLKRDYLKVKTVDLLLEEPAATLLKMDEQSGKLRLSIQLPGSIHEEIQDIVSIQVLKAKEHGLKLAIDISRSSLEPVIAAIMQHCHILDMTISDPPMEEIIATIYGQKEGETPFMASPPDAELELPETTVSQENSGMEYMESTGTRPAIEPESLMPFAEGD